MADLATGGLARPQRTNAAPPGGVPRTQGCTRCCVQRPDARITVMRANTPFKGRFCTHNGVSRGTPKSVGRPRSQSRVLRTLRTVFRCVQTLVVWCAGRRRASESGPATAIDQAIADEDIGRPEGTLHGQGHTVGKRGLDAEGPDVVGRAPPAQRIAIEGLDFVVDAALERWVGVLFQSQRDPRVSVGVGVVVTGVLESLAGCDQCRVRRPCSAGRAGKCRAQVSGLYSTLACASQSRFHGSGAEHRTDDR